MSKTLLKVNFALDSKTKPVTADDYCRSLTGVNLVALVEAIQIGGNAYLDRQIEILKSKLRARQDNLLCGDQDRQLTTLRVHRQKRQKKHEKRLRNA